MSRKHWIVLSLVAFVAAGLTAGVAWAEEAKAEGQKAEAKKEEAKKEAPKVELSEAAAKAVKEAFPNATIEKVEAEEEDGVKLFEVDLKDGEAEVDVSVAADGMIVEIEMVVALKDVPEAAAAAIKKAAEGGEIQKIEKSEVRAEVKKEGDAAKLVKLEKAKVTFEAKTTKGKVVVTADGAVVKCEEKKPEEKKPEEKKPEEKKAEEKK